jgi:hypothetical protein
MIDLSERVTFIENKFSPKMIDILGLSDSQ